MTCSTVTRAPVLVASTVMVVEATRVSPLVGTHGAAVIVESGDAGFRADTLSISDEVAPGRTSSANNASSRPSTARQAPTASRTARAGIDHQARRMAADGSRTAAARLSAGVP